tara:strand:+ start:68 stop:247 length:180 start_codon:yes stop_codon:yes gene_type:complete
VKRIISVNDDLYLIKGTVSVDTHFTTSELKKQYTADTVLRNGDFWYMCEKVIVAEFEDL